MITLDEVVDELLSFEEKQEEVNPTLFQRIHNFAKRKEIEKQLQEEVKFENEKILKSGHDAEAFLNSKWYIELIEPQLRHTVKGGLQTIIREGENMTEAQIKSEIACIKKALSYIASLKLKIIRAKQLGQ